MPRVVHMEGSIPSFSTMLVPKNTDRNTTAAPAEAPNTFQENFFRGSLGNTFMARITAIIMIRVTHCRWDRE